MRLLEEVETHRPNDPEVMREQVQSRTRLGMMVWITSKTADRALAELHRALDFAERLVIPDDQRAKARAILAKAGMNL